MDQPSRPGALPARRRGVSRRLDRGPGAHRRDAGGPGRRRGPDHLGRADPLDRRHRGAAVPAEDGERQAVAVRQPARRCCDCYDYSPSAASAPTAAASSSSGPGRGHIQYLASLFHPDTPNDVAPDGLQRPGPGAGLPSSPSRPSRARRASAGASNSPRPSPLDFAAHMPVNPSGFGGLLESRAWPATRNGLRSSARRAPPTRSAGSSSRSSRARSRSPRVTAGGTRTGTPPLRTRSRRRSRLRMPKDNIERAIAQGTGAGADAAAIETVTYEGYGPGGVAILIECLTDNRNRTAADMRQSSRGPTPTSASPARSLGCSTRRACCWSTAPAGARTT